MLRGFFGNLIFAIIARMLCGNHLNSKIVLVCLCYVCISNKFNKSKVEEWGGGVYREAN